MDPDKVFEFISAEPAKEAVETLKSVSLLLRVALQEGKTLSEEGLSDSLRCIDHAIDLLRLDS